MCTEDQGRAHPRNDIQGRRIVVAASHGVWVRLSQPIREYTSIRVNWTRRTLVFVNPPAAVTRKQVTGSMVGLDLGVVRTIAVSDGTFHDQPATADLEEKIRYHSRRMAKSRKINNPGKATNWTPTKGYRYHRDAAAKAHQDKTARLTDWRHKVTTSLVRTDDIIGIEDLDVQGMTRSARGTITNPGTNVAQKQGLNRSLARAAFATLRAMLAYKTDALIAHGHDQELLAVPPTQHQPALQPVRPHQQTEPQEPSGLPMPHVWTHRKRRHQRISKRARCRTHTMGPDAAPAGRAIGSPSGEPREDQPSRGRRNPRVAWHWP